MKIQKTKRLFFLVLCSGLIMPLGCSRTGGKCITERLGPTEKPIAPSSSSEFLRPDQKDCANDRRMAVKHIGGAHEDRETTNMTQIEDDEVRSLILGAPSQNDYPEAGAIVLLDEAKLTVYPDSTQTRQIHRVIKILNARGKHRAEVTISFNSLNETIRIDLARTIKPDGRIVNVGKETMRDVTPWRRFALYSSTKVRVISMPEAVRGAIIEYKATVSSVGSPFGDYFTDFFGFQEYDPIMISRYILEAPKGLQFKTHFIHTEPIQPRIERLNREAQSGRRLSCAGYIDRQYLEEDILSYTWELKGMPPIRLERRMPGLTDIVPMILVSSFPDWATFKQWWWNLTKDRIETDEAIREKVLELTVGQKTPEEKARAIYHYVTSEIRYVGLEYGKGAFRPHDAWEVFANKYGDCKDQAILLVAMLREMGISAYPALIGTRGRIWELQRSIPMSQFNHVIVLAEIEGEQVWLDPTAWLSPFGELPGYDQGRLVLVFFEDKGRFLKTPIIPSEKNKKIQEIEIGISGDGAMSAKVKVTVCGWVAQGIRHLLKSKNPQGRIDEVKDLVNGYCPGAILKNCCFFQLDDPSLPVIIEYEFFTPDYIKSAGGLLLFRLPWLFRETNGVGKDRRIYPVVWPNTQSDEIRISIQIPQGYRVQSIPETFELKPPFATYRLEYTKCSGRILVDSFSEQRTLTIGVDEYPSYKKYTEEIAKEVDKCIILERAKEF